MRVSGDRASLERTLRERTEHDDDIAASVFVERDLLVVLRLRFEGGRRVLIVDNGRCAVQVEHLATPASLEHLAHNGGTKLTGYEFARAVIARAFQGR